MFSETDLKLLKDNGISIDIIESQIERFKKGSQFLTILQPAIISCGIIQLSEKKLKSYIRKFEKKSTKLELLKFVPASGAATRMFSHLFEFKKDYKESPEKVLDLLRDRDFNSTYYFLENLDNFAFYNDLVYSIRKKGGSIDDLINDKRYGRILSALLTKKGLNYGNLPKGLIKFHKYEDFSRTSFEEHLVEGVHYCQNINKEINIHFTVSEEHKEIFINHINRKYPRFEEIFAVKYKISLSVQDPSTNTIAVTENNLPARDAEGKLIFRPGGHGALLKNLNDLDADIIFIKNIDNVVPDDYKNQTYIYKKALAGILLTIQQKIFKYLNEISGKNRIDKKYLEKLLKFIKTELCILPPKDIKNWSIKAKLDYVIKKLDRPIRVCGMVENEDEPGGGPFLAENNDQSYSLQIVEMAQINLKDKKQLSIIKNSTHFNPVDLVCGTKNYKGEKFNLMKYTDPEAGFISEKTKGELKIKALELPGLWNGAMSDWNTIFVEVPLITFNPVKIVNDLLRKEHQTISKK